MFAAPEAAEPDFPRSMALRAVLGFSHGWSWPPLGPDQGFPAAHLEGFVDPMSEKTLGQL